MRIIIHTIQTKRCTWEVSIEWFGVGFSIIRSPSNWEPVPLNAVPKTIRRRAKSFLLEPKRYGVVKYR